MKKTSIFIAAIICMILLVGCGTAVESKESPAEVCVVPFSVSDDMPRFELRIAPAENRPTYSPGEETTGYVYSVEVVELREPEQSDRSVQLFTVFSSLEEADELISLFDINHDKCRDIIVQTYHTPHSAAWYSAYRWLPDEERFEAEPFFEYLCSGQPEPIRSCQLLTYDVTASSRETILYELDQAGHYFPLRTLSEEWYDRQIYTVTRTEDGEVLYSREYSLEHTLSTEEIIDINSFLFYGEAYPFVNKMIGFAKLYCLCREDWRYGSGDILPMLADDEHLRASEQAYVDGKDSDAICDGVMVTKLEAEDAGMCRVNVICHTKRAEDEAAGLYRYEEKLLSLLVGAKLGKEEVYVFGVEEVSGDSSSWFAAERRENGEFSFFINGGDGSKAELTEWRCELLPGVSVVDEDVMQLCMGVGTGFWGCAYFRADTGESSGSYTNAYYLGNDIILIADRTSEIRIVNAFDEGRYSYSLYPDFAPVPIPSSCRFECELLDGTHIRLTYCDKEWQYVERIYTIPDIYE